MKTALFYVALFLTVFFLTYALSGAGTPPGPRPQGSRDRVIQMPFQDFYGVIKV